MRNKNILCPASVVCLPHDHASALACHEGDTLTLLPEWNIGTKLHNLACSLMTGSHMFEWRQELSPDHVDI
jgi:hypothetical protein